MTSSQEVFGRLRKLIANFAPENRRANPQKEAVSSYSKTIHFQVPTCFRVGSHGSVGDANSIPERGGGVEHPYHP